MTCLGVKLHTILRLEPMSQSLNCLDRYRRPVLQDPLIVVPSDHLQVVGGEVCMKQYRQDDTDQLPSERGGTRGPTDLAPSLPSDCCK